MANPIKYSDLVVPDDSISTLITQLQELQKTYAQMASSMKSEAKSLRDALQNVSGAGEDGRTTIDQTAKAADELEAAHKRLNKAQNETAIELARVNQQLKEQNQLNALNARAFDAQAGSYNELAARLAQLKVSYQALSAEQRKSSQGESMRTDIAKLRGELASYNLELQKAIKLEELKAKRDASAKGSYDRLSATYSIMKQKLNQMGEATDKDAKAKRRMEEAAKAVYMQMIKLQEATGKHTLSVGNYRKTWDGLRFSVFQVVRELPNAAVSMNTLFLAISNNLPVVADEIARVRQENIKLQSEGKPTTSVLKQVASAFLSWHTVLILGISALTMFGDKILDWIGNLFKGGAAAKTMTEALDDVNAALKENAQGYGANVVAYKKLQAEWKNLSGLKEREKWLKENASAYQALTDRINNVNDADNYFIKNTNNVIKSFQLRAKAAAAKNLAEKEYEKAFQLQVENSKKTGTASDLSIWQLIGIGASRAMGRGGINEEQLAQIELAKAQKEINVAMQNAEQFMKMFISLDNEAAELGGEPAKGGGKTKTKKTRAQATKDFKDMTKDINDIIRQVTQAYNESATALMGSGIDTNLAKIDDKVSKSINSMEKIRDKIQHWLNDPKKFHLTDAQRGMLEGLKIMINDTIGNMRTAGDIEKGNARTGYAAKNAQFESRMRQLYGEGMLGASLQETFLQRKSVLDAAQDSELKALDNTYKLRYDLISKGDKGELEQLQKYLREKDLILKKYGAENTALGADYANTRFANEQQLTQIRFNGSAISPSRRQKLAFDYNQETAKLRQQIQDPRTSPEQREIIQAQMDALKATFDKNNRPQNIWETMGLELNSDDMAAIDAGKTYAMDAINSLMQLEQAWADKAVENAQRRVDAAKNALQIEKEARANGYANNVEYAQKEYEASKKQQQKALKQRERIQKAQIAIDTATQVSNLVTATAGIWKTFATMSQPWLAPAMIALMWGSFAASKVMAMKLTSEQNDKEEYAEGHVELLEGGSHASGHDIDLGVKPDGTRRRAEGGEYFAVINKRNSRKYRGQIPNIINALNSGTFDKKYILAEKAAADASMFTSAYDRAGNIIIRADRHQTDLTRLENDVRRLREQGERRTMIDSKGNEIVYYKNVRRVITRA